MISVGAIEVACPHCEHPIRVDLTGIPKRGVSGEVQIRVSVDERKLVGGVGRHVAERHSDAPPSART